MSVEAKDQHNPSMTCAATIQRINHQGKLLIHFDGWTQHFDYWCEPSTTDIHPPMWCDKNNKKVEPPNGMLIHELLYNYSALAMNVDIVELVNVTNLMHLVKRR